MKNNITPSVAVKAIHARSLSWYLMWAGTICILSGAACTCFEIIPLNIILSGTGWLFWLVVGVLWWDRALILLNIIVSSIYFIGLIRYFVLITEQL